jgi:hypothetical protein
MKSGLLEENLKEIDFNQICKNDNELIWKFESEYVLK